MTDIPENYVNYARSPDFDEVSLPAALRKDHQTKATVWGLIVVEKGVLIYTRKDQSPVRVAMGETAVIYPEEPHAVTPDGVLLFHVDFYRPAEAEL
jgi:tellurite resistance-related uncharacterized protein